MTTYTGGIAIHGGNPSASDSVTLNGTAGVVADVISVTLAAAGDTVTGAVGGTVTLTGIELLTINSGLGNDTLSVNEFGAASDLTSVTVNSGGDASDTFTLNGTANPDSLQVTPISATSVVATAGVGPLLTVNLAAVATSTYTVHGQGSTDAVTVHGSAAGDNILVTRAAGATTVDVNTFKRIRLSEDAPNALVVASGLGDDVITVTGSGGPVLTVDGGAPAASDTLVMLSAAAAASFIVNPGSTNDAGSVTMDGSVTQYTDIEAITLDAGGGASADSLTVNGTAGSDAVTVTADSATNGGTINASFAPALTFNNFTTASSLSINTLGGDDLVIVNHDDGWAITTVTLAGGIAGLDRCNCWVMTQSMTRLPTPPPRQPRARSN